MNSPYIPPRSILEALLFDHSTGRNIIWATDDYAEQGRHFHDEMIMRRDGEKGVAIIRRALKDKAAQTARARGKAEVSTPAWICRAQLDAVDEAWRQAHEGNKEEAWRKYVSSVCLEVACGEGPYMAMRQDAATGENIPIEKRGGILDRKLRIVGEHTQESGEWAEYALLALKTVYGFEWQGDSLFLARKELILDYAEYYMEKFGSAPSEDDMMQAADVIAWNVFQMDGLKGVVPGSCHETESPAMQEEQNAFSFAACDEAKLPLTRTIPCPGCAKGDMMRHNGVYAVTMDWDKGEKVKFADLMFPRGYRI